MELIIKIPQWVYESVKNGTFDAKRSPYDLEYVLKYGYPLPAKHGRLVDMSKFDSDRIEREYSIEAVSFDYLDSLPTIIEADKEAENEDRD